MAQYDPPQPLWKRNTAAILDCLLVLIVGGHLLAKPRSTPPPPFAPGVTMVEVFHVEPWAIIVLIFVIIAYFVILGRTGGTIFQRLFGMKRAT